jgi:hypothetical protein
MRSAVPTEMPKGGARRPRLRRFLNRVVSVLLVFLVFYSIAGLLLGIAVILYAYQPGDSGWGKGLVLGSAVVAVGACLSWRRPLPGGLLIVLGAIPATVSVTVLGRPGCPGCLPQPPRSAGVVLEYVIGAGGFPIIVGLLAVFTAGQRHRKRTAFSEPEPRKDQQ